MPTLKPVILPKKEDVNKRINDLIDALNKFIDDLREILNEMDYYIGVNEQIIEYDSGTTIVDWANGNKASMTFGQGNITIFSFLNPPKQCNLILKIKQDSIGSRIVSNWDTSIKWVDGTPPTLSTGANDIDILSFYFDGTYYYGQIALDFS